MPRKARRVESGLLAKGFRTLDSRHRRLFYYTLGGQPTSVSTLLSHGGNRDISDQQLSQMARQCRLSRRDFLALIDCPLSQEGYEGLLVERGHV